MKDIVVYMVLSLLLGVTLIYGLITPKFQYKYVLGDVITVKHSEFYRNCMKEVVVSGRRNNGYLVKAHCGLISEEIWISRSQITLDIKQK